MSTVVFEDITFTKTNVKHQLEKFYLICFIDNFSGSVSGSRLIWSFIPFCLSGRGSAGYDAPGGGGVEVVFAEDDDGRWLEKNYICVT